VRFLANEAWLRSVWLSLIRGKDQMLKESLAVSTIRTLFIVSAAQGFLGNQADGQYSTTLL